MDYTILVNEFNNIATSCSNIANFFSTLNSNVYEEQTNGGLVVDGSSNNNVINNTTPNGGVLTNGVVVNNEITPIQEPASFVTTMGDVIPNFAANYTVLAPWTTAPQSTDKVVIPAGVSVSLVNDLICDSLTIHGTLTFASPCTLKAANIIVAKEGSFILENVDGAKIIIADKPIDITSDPNSWGTGFIGLGTVSICGAAKTPFVQLSQEPHRGDVILHFTSPVSGWLVGDTLVLPETRTPSKTLIPNNEELTIASIATDNLSVTITNPLAVDHKGGYDATLNLKVLPHVANITRSVTIESENPNGTRGHFVVTDMAMFEMCDVEMVDLGRTTILPVGSSNSIGRYAGTHMHHLMTSNWSVTGIVVRATTVKGKWGINIHDSHYGTVSNNVVYNIPGAGIHTEAGSEKQNIISNNFCIFITGDGTRDNPTGTNGSGIWLAGVMNHVVNNISAACSSLHIATSDVYSYGIYVYPLDGDKGPVNPGDPPSAYVTYNQTSQPITEMSGNTAYACSNGFSLWRIRAYGMFTYGSGQSVFSNQLVWNHYHWGYYGYETCQLTLDNIKVYADPTVVNPIAIGLWSGDYRQQGLVYKNLDVQSCSVGVITPWNANGLTTIQDSYFDNKISDINVQTPSYSNGPNIAAKSLLVSNCVHNGVAPGRTQNAIEMDYVPPSTRNNCNYILADTVQVTSFNGVVGDDFHVLYNEQDASFVLPQTNASGSNCIGSPDAGLTNQQNWTAHQIALAGSVAPTTNTRIGIKGLVA